MSSVDRPRPTQVTSQARDGRHQGGLRGARGRGGGPGPGRGGDGVAAVPCSSWARARASVATASRRPGLRADLPRRPRPPDVRRGAGDAGRARHGGLEAFDVAALTDASCVVAKHVCGVAPDYSVRMVAARGPRSSRSRRAVIFLRVPRTRAASCSRSWEAAGRARLRHAQEAHAVPGLQFSPSTGRRADVGHGLD